MSSGRVGSRSSYSRGPAELDGSAGDGRAAQIIAPMRDDDEMRDKDAAEFGAIVDSLVGGRCERTLATNTIKLRFNTQQDPRGRQYIWIDPPWALFEGDRGVTTSADYDEGHFAAWIELLQPMDSTLLEAWHEDDSGGSVFVFSHGYRLVVPHSFHGWRTPGTSTGMRPSQPLPRLDSPFLTRRLTKRPPRQGHGSTLGRSPEGRASIPAGSDNGPPFTGALTGQRMRRESLRSARTLPPV